jgi:hypothetical protein
MAQKPHGIPKRGQGPVCQELTVMFFAMVTLAASTATGVFTDYPGFLDPNSEIEAIVDRGPISELIVKCGPGTAILSYSKIEDLYCTPNGSGCFKSFDAAMSNTCE